MSITLDLRPLVRFCCRASLKKLKAVSIQYCPSLSMLPSAFSRLLAVTRGTWRYRRRYQPNAHNNTNGEPCCKVTSRESLPSPWCRLDPCSEDPERKLPPIKNRTPLHYALLFSRAGSSLFTGIPSEETNWPTTDDAPVLCSWNDTSDTIILSSSTDPQLVHTESPLAWSCSMSVPPQLEHTVGMVARQVGMFYNARSL